MGFVKSIINEWDPIDLLSHAPDNEYSSEIEEIEDLLRNTEDITEVTEGIYNIFIKYFGEDTFTNSLSECAQIAQKLLSRSLK